MSDILKCYDCKWYAFNWGENTFCNDKGKDCKDAMKDCQLRKAKADEVGH